MTAFKKYSWGSNKKGEDLSVFNFSGTPPPYTTSKNKVHPPFIKEHHKTVTSPHFIKGHSETCTAFLAPLKGL